MNRDRSKRFLVLLPALLIHLWNTSTTDSVPNTHSARPSSECWSCGEFCTAMLLELYHDSGCHIDVLSPEIGCDDSGESQTTRRRWQRRNAHSTNVPNQTPKKSPHKATILICYPEHQATQKPWPLRPSPPPQHLLHRTCTSPNTVSKSASLVHGRRCLPRHAGQGTGTVHTYLQYSQL